MYILHKFNKRYLSVNLDPVLACNLRCKMCYFTDKDYVKKLKGQFKQEELERVAEVVFPRALKLQVGCGTEPTLYKRLPELIALGKRNKVPYISLTTNANLLTEDSIEDLVKAGLNEFTISLHGVTKKTYESFMGKGDYEKFQNALNLLGKYKKKYDFKVRVNYTFNKDNFYELEDFFDNFNPESMDFLQIRPIRKIGNTEYNNFDISSLVEDYPKVMKKIEGTCKSNKITLLAPNSILSSKKVNEASFIYDYTFCYVSPISFWKDGFNWREETFNDFSKRIGWGKLLLANVFKSKKEFTETSGRLDYEVNFN
ncbi:radical SAM protein [Gaetbulibacter aestuarii]|uniref:radical SAM protein n=1 Tax=Gaetbulibacter aestuarii TaxID=1502358 RepID=UPI0031E35F0D